jgi:hypothetical protein
VTAPVDHYFMSDAQVRRLLSLASPAHRTAGYIAFLLGQYFKTAKYADGRSITPWLRMLVAKGVLECNPKKYKGVAVYRVKESP